MTWHQRIGITVITNNVRSTEHEKGSGLKSFDSNPGDTDLIRYGVTLWYT